MALIFVRTDGNHGFRPLGEVMEGEGLREWRLAAGLRLQEAEARTCPAGGRCTWSPRLTTKADQGWITLRWNSTLRAGEAITFWRNASCCLAAAALQMTLARVMPAVLWKSSEAK